METIPPFHIKIKMSLKERDEQFIKMQELIKLKQTLLCNKQDKFNKISKQNHFLEFIKEDYSRYFNYINQQKIDQINALKLLNLYIDDLTNSGKLTKHNIEDAKEEQNKILREIKHIKANIDNIVNNTKEIQEFVNN
jgi:hypothetical protein